MPTPLHVLILTDSAHTAAVFVQTLRDRNCNPVWEQVESAAAFAVVLTQRTWDLVLCSPTVPYCPTMTVLEILHDHGCTTPCVIVADEIQEEEVAAAIRAGAADYLRTDQLARLPRVIGRESQDADCEDQALHRPPDEGGDHENGHALTTGAHGAAERQAEVAPPPHQTSYDTLTGLPDRALFHSLLQGAVRAARQHRQRFALLLLDLDRFRDINDTFGHHWGDMLLQQIAPRLQSALRKTDTVARLGGDEFAVLLSTVNDAADAAQLARRLLQALEEPFRLHQYTVDADVSIGIALAPEHGTDADALLRRADIALYMAKRMNSGYALYSDEQERRYTPGRLVLLSQLRQGMEHAQLVLHYQPKVSLSTLYTSQVEALVRWQHPERGTLLPDQFIPLAEHSGLIKSLSRCVLTAALRQCHAWRRAGLALDVAVNLSMRDLQDATLPDTVALLLEAWGVAPAWLEVEITETAIAADFARALETLTRLGQMGIRLTLDDFGTGYSSLTFLKQLPVDAIKIDKSFVQDMAVDRSDAAIVRSTIELAHNLGLKVVAEGVEDQATWDMLSSFGCDFAQGYFLSQPVPAEDLERWLSSGAPRAGNVVAPPPSRKKRLDAA